MQPYLVWCGILWVWLFMCMFKCVCMYVGGGQEAPSDAATLQSALRDLNWSLDSTAAWLQSCQRNICRRVLQTGRVQGEEATISQSFPLLAYPCSRWAPIFVPHSCAHFRQVRRFCTSSSCRGHRCCGPHPQNSRWRLCPPARWAPPHRRDAAKKVARHQEEGIFNALYSICIYAKRKSWPWNIIKRNPSRNNKCILCIKHQSIDVTAMGGCYSISVGTPLGSIPVARWTCVFHHTQQLQNISNSQSAA